MSEAACEICGSPDDYCGSCGTCFKCMSGITEQQLATAHRAGWEQCKQQIIEEWEKPHGLTDGSKFIDRLRNLEYKEPVT